MLTVYTYKESDEYLYILFENDITLQDAKNLRRIFEIFFMLKKDAATITEYRNASLVEREFISEMAKTSVDFSDKYNEAYIFGLTGIQNSFYMDFASKVGKNSVKYHLLNNKRELEESLGLSLQEDFNLYKKFS